MPFKNTNFGPPPPPPAVAASTAAASTGKINVSLGPSVAVGVPVWKSQNGATSVGVGATVPVVKSQGKPNYGAGVSFKFNL